MPLVTAQNHIKGLLDALSVPGPSGIEPLHAFITPPDPYTESAPAAYIWPARGTEARQSLPRNRGGVNGAWKTVKQDIEVYLVWFGSDSDPDADSAFPSIVDAVLNALRTSPDPAIVTDPDSGMTVELCGVGEDMSWQLGPVRSVADERYLRYDALVRVPFSEFIQA
ncbi:hypothetical protein GCM10023196_036930 [Actinoallomurus vinaceus]|uniref:Tail terminator n=1 Tax=Actinoallomurus vinaceus TaxID=1080074 RepID=A0ABP8UCI2_9ACTN